MYYRFPTLFPKLLYCLLAIIALISINHDNQFASAQNQACNNIPNNQSASAQSTASKKASAIDGTFFISVQTDRAKYTKGHDVIISGNVSDVEGNKVSKVVTVEISQLGTCPQITGSVFAKNGSFYFKQPDIGLGMNSTGTFYNVTAVLNEGGKAWTSFEVSGSPWPYFTIIMGTLSLAGYGHLLIRLSPRKFIPWLLGEEDVNSQGKKDVNSQGKKDVNSQGKKDVNSQGKKDVNSQGKKDVNSQGKKDVTLLSGDELYIPGVLRFITLSGIALTPFTMFIYHDSEYGVNSPIGLVKESSNSNGILTQWVINVGGSDSDNYSQGLQIPFYVVVFGLAGGYLAYLYKAAFKSENKKKPHNLREMTPPEFMEETLGELSHIILAPYLAIAAWFLLSVAGNPSVYTIGAVSFTVGLATKSIVHRLENFVVNALGNSKGDKNNVQSQDKRHRIGS